MSFIVQALSCLLQSSPCFYAFLWSLLTLYLSRSAEKIRSGDSYSFFPRCTSPLSAPVCSLESRQVPILVWISSSAPQSSFSSSEQPDNINAKAVWAGMTILHLIAPESIFVKPSEAVDNNRDWQGKSEDTKNRTQSSKNLAHKCLKMTYSLRIFSTQFPVLHQDLRHSPL